MTLEVNIKKTFPAFTLDVAFEAGDETLGFLGASGCGKSLTLRCIAGLETPDEGRIVVNDRVFFDSEKKINLTPQQRKTALLFQNYQLFPNMTVAQNVAAGLDRKMPKAERDAIVAKQLENFDLQGFEDRYPTRLSGGQQQRVALARMLAASPDILMLDEPFSALDSHLKNSLEQVMLDVFDNYQGTILYISHDIDEAYRLCDRIAVVSAGHIEDIDTVEQVVLHPSSLAALKLTGCKNISRARKVTSHRAEAVDWGVVLGFPDEEVPDNLAYVGARANFIHRAKDDGDGGFELEVYRVTENRFDCLVVLIPPSGDKKNLIYWRQPKKFNGDRGLPVPGEKVHVHFDARHLDLICE